MNKGGHWPFTSHYNRDGRITPEKLLAAVKAGGGIDNELCLELAFRFWSLSEDAAAGRHLWS